MKETIFSTIKTAIITSARQVNDCARGGDVNRNRVNYGSVIAYASVLRDMGHNVDVAVWEDGGLLKIPKITVGPETFNFPDGQ